MSSDGLVRITGPHAAVWVRKAEAMPGEDAPLDLELHVTDRTTGPLDAEADAIIVADWLLTSLPGSTVDLLTAELMRRLASRLVVAHDRTVPR